VSKDKKHTSKKVFFDRHQTAKLSTVELVLPRGFIEDTFDGLLVSEMGCFDAHTLDERIGTRPKARISELFYGSGQISRGVKGSRAN
jgi:hypothetical protein